MSLKHFFKNEMCSIFYLYLISCGCFFTVVWNEASLNRAKAHTTGSLEITADPSCPQIPATAITTSQTLSSYIMRPERERVGSFFPFIFIQHLVLSKINPITLCLTKYYEFASNSMNNSNVFFRLYFRHSYINFSNWFEGNLAMRRKIADRESLIFLLL